jgi:undecaprenyl-phosphate 4-deoxy-4-formamido-L-arabinose transferase
MPEQSRRLPTVSVVVPVYRGEGCLLELHRRLIPVLESVSGAFEILLVDDCSPDNSWQVIGELASIDKRVRGIRLSRNFGQHNALLCGIRKAQYDVVVTLDDDLQNPPEDLPLLLNRLAEGFDVVYGAPEKERNGFLRDIASRATKLALQSAMGAVTAGNISTYRAFRRDLVRAFDMYQSTYVSIDVLLTWGTTRFSSVRVRHEKRHAGVSGYTLRRLVRHAMNMLTGFSVLPLQIASVTGFAFSLFGIVVLVYVVCRYLLDGTPVQGFPFLASIIAIFSGAQLFSIGIIGEYLARMYFRVINRPPYNIRNDTGDMPGN